MWQAKCFEEQGEIGPAIGLYKQLLEHTDPRLRDAPAQRRLLLHRRPGQAQGVRAGGRRGHRLAREASTVARSGGRKEGLGVLLELAKAIDAQMPEIADGRSSQGRPPDHRRREPGRPLRLAVQERGAGAAQEIQAQRRDEGRGDRPPHLPGRHGEGRRGDRLARVGPRHHPAQGGHAQGRHRPRDRQGQPGAVQPGLLLLHEQAILRSRRPGRAPGPALPAGGPVVQGDADRRCRRWPTRTTRTPRSTGCSDLDRLVELAPVHGRDVAGSRGRRRRPAEPRPDLLWAGASTTRRSRRSSRSAAARASGSRRRRGWAPPTGPRAGCSSGGATPSRPAPRPRRRSTCSGRP